MIKYLVFLVFIVTLVIGCADISDKQPGAAEIPDLPHNEDPEVVFKSLSEIQIIACETAQESGTCDTRLPELGIVLKEDCCDILDRCC